ncbi:MAG: hypothetical protein GY856_38775 [bacterium]|nr:hypothetical protein [bacterium]
MFESTSRYAELETVRRVLPDGRVIAYQRRRFLPRGDEMALLVEVTVSEGERLDQITGRTLGDPEQYWRICDASDAMNPAELMRPGQKLRVPLPQA